MLANTFCYLRCIGSRLLLPTWVSGQSPHLSTLEFCRIAQRLSLFPITLHAISFSHLTCIQLVSKHLKKICRKTLHGAASSIFALTFCLQVLKCSACYSISVTAPLSTYRKLFLSVHPLSFSVLTFLSHLNHMKKLTRKQRFPLSTSFSLSHCTSHEQ